MSYRAIDVSGFDRTIANPGQLPDLQWLRIADLVIDDSYQRPLLEGNRKAIQRIASEFQWARFSPVLVAPIEGGRYAIIDGQHRSHAAAVCGFEMVPAMILDVQPAAQAAAFVRINTSQIAIRSTALYKAALVAGERWAVNCAAAVSAAGCTLMTSNASTKNKKPGQVFAVVLVRELVNAGHAKAVTAGLQALMEFDPASVPNFSDALLKPWLGAVAEVKDGHKADLAGVLRANRPWLVLERAERAAKAAGWPLAAARRAAFVTLISAHMRAGV